MKLLLRTTLALGTTLAFSAAAFAADYVKLTNGTLVRGEAIAFDEATQTLTFRMEDGSQRGFKLDELDKRSVYLVHQSRVPKDDATKQIRIGNLAREAELFAHAMRHYGYAEKADPSRKPEIDRERAKLKQLAAAYGMQKARAAIEKRDLSEAEQWLVKLVEKLPDEPQSAEAAAMLERYYSARRAEREAKAELKAGAQLKKDLATGKRLYESMVAKTQKGLTAKTSSSTADDAFAGAIADGKRVLAELDRLERKYSDAATRETLGGYRAMVIEQLVEVHLHVASALTTRSSYNKALAAVNQGLALDPQNKRALEARVRIEQAASEPVWRW